MVIPTLRLDFVPVPETVEVEATAAAVSFTEVTLFATVSVYVLLPLSPSANLVPQVPVLAVSDFS